MSLVSLTKIVSSDVAELRKAIDRSLDLIRFDFEKNVKKAAIKPNMCYYHHPSTGDVTDPRFVGVLIDVLRGRFCCDPEIVVVEADASAMFCKYAFKMLGYERMAKEKDIRLVNLSEEANKIVDVRVNDWYLRFRVPETLSDADIVVNVPKLKYMGHVRMTCALKNMYGCNAFAKKAIYHPALNEAIVGINKLVKSDLVVVDGVMVSGKKTKRLGLVMASRDPVAIDTVASRIMGIDPRSVDQIVLASENGIGSMEYVALGDPVSYFEKSFPRPTISDRTYGVLGSLYSHLLKD